MQESPPRMTSLLSAYPQLLSYPLGSSTDTNPALSRDMLPVLETLVQSGNVADIPGGEPPPVTETAIGNWSEFWSRPTVVESLSLAVKSPLPAGASASFLAPHLLYLGPSNVPLRVVVTDGPKKRVSIPQTSSIDDVDKSAVKPSRSSRESPLKRSGSSTACVSASPSKIQKISSEKVDAPEASESSATAPPPTPRNPTPRAPPPTATPRSFPPTVSPTPLSIQQLNQNCGVAVQNGWCLHAVDSCRIHNEKARRAVLGRGCEFDSILARCFARRSFHDFTITEMGKSGGMCSVPYPHTTYPPIVGGFRSGIAVDSDDDRSVLSDSRLVFFSGKKSEDFVVETIGGLKPKYNFKAPFDRYEPTVVRNIMSDLFRVASDPLFLPLRRPCVPFVKPPPVLVATPQASTPVSTPRAASTKVALGMQGSASFPTPQPQPPVASPRAPSFPTQASVANASPTVSLSSAAAPQSQQRPPSKSSKASASQATSNSNLGPSSSVKAASAASGSGTPNAAGHTPIIVGGSTSSATIGNTQPQSAKTSTYGPPNVAAAQNVPYNASAATGNVGVSTTNPASTPAVGSVAASKSSFNIADGSSRGAASTSQSAAATVSTGSTPRAAKNNAGAQAVAGPVYEVPLHLVQSSQKPVPGLRYRNITVQYLRECDINKILPTSFRRYCVIQLAHLQEITTAFIISKNGFELELAKDTDPPPCTQHSWFALQYNNTPCIIETQIITATGTRFLVYADLRCMNCHQVSFLYDKATNDRARADQSKQAAAQAAAAATAQTSGTGTPTSATKAANRRTAAKNAKAAAASAVSATTASNVTVGGTVPATATSIATGAATISTSASATISPATAVSAGAGQPTPAQAVAPGPTASAPKASKSRSKVQIDYSSEPSATYLAQLQASSGSSTLPASAAVTTPKSKAAAGQMAATNLPSARNVVLAPSFSTGSTPQSSLQTGVPSSNLKQPIGHPGMMPVHPHYAPSSQAHFGVAPPVYPPTGSPVYYPGAPSANGAQGQYMGVAGQSAVGSSPQNQMQFGAQALPATLPQPSTFTPFPNAHVLPPPSSALVQAGSAASAAQFLPGPSLDGMPPYSASPSRAPIQQYHYSLNVGSNINVGSLGSSADFHGVASDMNVHQGSQSIVQGLGMAPQQQLSLQQQHDSQQHLQPLPMVQQQLLQQQQQQQQTLHQLPQEMQQGYSQQQSQQLIFQQQQQQQHSLQQMHHPQQQPTPYLPQSALVPPLNQGN